jgi:hypothetical protein
MVKRLEKMILSLWLIHFVEEQGQLLQKMEFSTERRSKNGGGSMLSHLEEENRCLSKKK